MGGSFGQTDGEYRGDASGTATGVLVGYRATAAGLVVGGSFNVQGPAGHTLVCLVTPTSDGECVPNFPDFMSIAALVGWEGGDGTTIRLMGGPAFVHADVGAFGLQGRVDLAVPLVWRISLAVSGRAALIPVYRGDAFRLGSFGVGLSLR